MLEQILSKYFQYDKIFNLINYDSNMILLSNELQKLTKSCYESNYRFIFCQWDTDYYLPNNTAGFTLRNLQRILVQLDIPNYFCLLITQQNIDNELEQLRTEECFNDPHTISCFRVALQKIYYMKDPQDEPLINVDKVFISLNGQARKHRTVIFSLLQYKNLIDKGIVSYGTTQSTNSIINL
jgi:hypothetical protein